MKPQWLKELEARNERIEFSIVANMSESPNWRLVRKKEDGTKEVIDTGVAITSDLPHDAEALRDVLPSDMTLSTVSDEDLEALEQRVRDNAVQLDVDISEEVPIPLTRIIRDASEVARDLGNHTSWLERRFEAIAHTAQVQGRKLSRIADVFGNVQLGTVSNPSHALECIRTVLLEHDPDGDSEVSIERMTLEFAQLQARAENDARKLARISLALFEGQPEPTPDNLRAILTEKTARAPAGTGPWFISGVIKG
jgi:hypothetical protein